MFKPQGEKCMLHLLIQITCLVGCCLHLSIQPVCQYKKKKAHQEFAPIHLAVHRLQSAISNICPCSLLKLSTQYSISLYSPVTRDAQTQKPEDSRYAIAVGGQRRWRPGSGRQCPPGSRGLVPGGLQSANLTLACFAAPALLGASDGAECGGADCGSPAPVPPSHPGGLPAWTRVARRGFKRVGGTARRQRELGSRPPGSRRRSRNRGLGHREGVKMG